MQAAAQSGDIGTILRIMAQASSLQPSDYIKKTVGSLRFLYYTYCHEFNCVPLDMEDMIDGLMYLDASGYITKQRLAQQAAQARARNNK